jgi:hypothetical protein
VWRGKNPRSMALVGIFGFVFLSTTASLLLVVFRTLLPLRIVTIRANHAKNENQRTATRLRRRERSLIADSPGLDVQEGGGLTRLIGLTSTQPFSLLGTR